MPRRRKQVRVSSRSRPVTSHPKPGAADASNLESRTDELFALPAPPDESAQRYHTWLPQRVEALTPAEHREALNRLLSDLRRDICAAGGAVAAEKGKLDPYFFILAAIFTANGMVLGRCPHHRLRK